MKLYRHRAQIELFGDDLPRNADEIFLKMCGDTNLTSAWYASRNEKLIGIPKLDPYIDLVSITNLRTRGLHDIDLQKGSYWRNLVKSIQEIGIQVPFLVVYGRPLKFLLPNQYYILEGGHRFAVAKYLGLRFLPTIILEEV